MAAEHEALSTGPPDRQLALDRYAGHAEQYDTQTDWASPDRRRAVSLLDLQPGEVVVDVGCGTGLCFGALLAGVGPSGSVLGVEPCAEMLVLAQERAEREAWANVETILGGAEEAKLGRAADAALFCFTHDVLRTPAALANILGQLKPGARVAAVGPMWAPWWAPGVNMVIWYVASQYVTTFEGFSAPWSHLAQLVPGLSVEPRELEGIFFAHGVWPGPASPTG